MTRSATLPPVAQAGKAAFKALVKAFGGQDAAAEECGIRQPRISDMGNPNVDEHPPLWMIDHLEDCTVGHPGWPHVTNWLCRRRGGVFVSLPQGPDDAGGIMESMVGIAGELGQVSRAVSDAVASASEGGAAIVAREARDILRELDEMDRTSATLRLRLNRIIGEGDGE